MEKELDNILEEVDVLFSQPKLKSVLSNHTLDDLNSYSDACVILNEKVLRDADYSKQIKTIVKAANFIDNNNQVWIADWKNHQQYKYAAYFIDNGSGFGLGGVNGGVNFWLSFTSSPLGFFYKESKTAELITNRFIKLYLNWLQK